MKKLIIITLAALTLSAAEAQAQNWLNALKSAATTAINKVTGGALTEKALIGSWTYSQPGVKLSSGDTLSELAAAAATTSIQQKMATYYEKVGIKAGTCSFVFNNDGSFSSTFGQKTFTGTYTFDAKTSQMSLKYTSGLMNLGAIPAYAYMNGENLQLVFPMDKLLSVITTLGSNLGSLSSITDLLKNYDSIKIGFEFAKAK